MRALWETPRGAPVVRGRTETAPVAGHRAALEARAAAMLARARSMPREAVSVAQEAVPVVAPDASWDRALGVLRDAFPGLTILT